MPANGELSVEDERTVVTLENKARSLVMAGDAVGDGDCSERAVAAFREAAAILRDAAALCRRSSMMHPEREF